MNLRYEWAHADNDVKDLFYSREETVADVVENFDIRRKHSAEGEELTINNVTDWCLVQTSSNPLKELDDIRKIHCPTTMDVQRGNYVVYENDIWLIDSNVVNVGNAYLSARMNRCSYRLKWQNSNGDIIERDIVSYNASAYNNGIAGNNVIKIGTDQLMIFLPYDEETKLLKRGRKFFIDNNMEDPMTYELTRLDRTTYVFNGVGCINLLVTECAYTPKSDDLIHEVCDYLPPSTSVNPPDETLVLSSIEGSKSLKIGYSRTYTVSFTDSEGNKISDVDFDWVIKSTFSDKIIQETDHDTIKLLVKDEDCIGSSFLLQVLISGIVSSEISIMIMDIY